MKRRRNKGGTKFYMIMSVVCLAVLFMGYSFVYSLSEKRKSGKDITTISIVQVEEKRKDKVSAIDKIMSYFNIFLEKTFKENENSGKLMENNSDIEKSQTDILHMTDNSDDSINLEIYNENNAASTEKNEVYLADNRYESFFKIIESSASRSSAPRDKNIDAALINDKLNIVIFHTHGTEAYLPHKDDNYRTKDEEYNVMGVGNKLTGYMQSLGINVKHLKDYNDFPDYNSSYANSAYAVSQVLTDDKKNIIIDIHRDGAEENSVYEKMLSTVTSAVINDKKAATCTLIVGDKNGNYEELKKNAQLLYNISDQMYPGLLRDIIVRNGAYFNQYYSDYALLIEVGSTLNHVDEINYTVELLSDVLVEYIDEIK